jgi:glycerophosphoryl diester phosphodiesterase
VTFNSVLVDAHRGSSAWFPENTLVAFEAAIASGADSVEFDVQVSSDGVPVVIHDDTVDRTTGGAGRVAELNYAELASLDAGTWKSPSFAGERIPTLDECLSLLTGMARINMELKADDPRLAGIAVEAIEGRRLHRQIMVSSFHLELLTAVRQRLPEVWTHYFFDSQPATDFWDRHGRELDSAGVAKDHLTPEVVEWCRAAGKPTWVWTVDDPVEAIRFAAMGVQSITTNDPVRIMTALADAGFREMPQFRLG